MVLKIMMDLWIFFVSPRVFEVYVELERRVNLFILLNGAWFYANLRTPKYIYVYLICVNTGRVFYYDHPKPCDERWCFPSPSFYTFYYPRSILVYLWIFIFYQILRVYNYFKKYSPKMWIYHYPTFRWVLHFYLKFAYFSQR